MLSLFLLSLFPSLVSTDTLLQVQVLHRHGDRTPIYTYKNDPWKQYWTLPRGTLTTIGMKQHFLQGTRLRKRYIDALQFVNGSYDPREIHIRSTDTQRCIQSVASNMAAFYKHSTFHPTDVENWPHNWTPMAIHTMPSDMDNLLEEGSSSCSRIHALKQKRLQRDEYQDYIFRNAQLLVELTIGSGKQITDAYSIDQLHDTLKVERIYNLTLPSWANDTVMKELQEVYIGTDDFLDGMAVLGGPEDVELLGLRSGTLLGQLIDNMNLAIDGKGTKMNLFSAHDSTISALFRIFHNKYAVLGHANPEYATMVAFELWKTSSGQYNVQVMYSNNCYTDFHPITNTIQGCPNSNYCSLDTLTNHYKSYIPTDFWKQCDNVNV